MSPTFPRLRRAGLTDADATRLAHRVARLAAEHTALARRLETELGLTPRDARTHVEEVVGAVVDQLGGAYHHRLAPHLTEMVRLRREIEATYEGTIAALRAAPDRPLGGPLAPARLERLLDELETQLLQVEGLSPAAFVASRGPADIDAAAVARDVVSARTAPGAPAPPAGPPTVTQAVRHGVAIQQLHTVSLGGGQAAELHVGVEADVSPVVREHVEAARAQTRGSGTKLEQRASATFEGAAVTHFVQQQLAREGLGPETLQPRVGLAALPYLPTAWSEPRAGALQPEAVAIDVNPATGQFTLGLAEGAPSQPLGSVIPEAIAIGRDPASGKVVISVAEATLQSDWTYEGPAATERGRKIGQFAGYLSGLDRLRGQLEASGHAPSGVEARLHYYALDPPRPETVRFMTDHIAQYGFPGVTVVWHQL